MHWVGKLLCTSAKNEGVSAGAFACALLSKQEIVMSNTD